MQKWEYCAIKGVASMSRDMHPNFPALWGFSVEGLKIIEMKGKDEKEQVAHAIARLGEDGWEMAGVGADGEVSHIIYFKRSKPE